MLRKTTLLVLLCAIALGAGAYFFDWKRQQNEKPPGDASKLAFTLRAEDIASLTIVRSSAASGAEPDPGPVRLKKDGGVWMILQPVETLADQSTVSGIVDQLAALEITQTEPGSADRRKVYGLDPPQISVEFELQNRATHTLLLGNKDFAGDAVYAIVDGAQNVSLLPDLLATGVGKGIDGLRDRTVLHIDSADLSSVSLKNSSGELVLAKEKGQWMFTKPIKSAANQDAVNALVQGVAGANWTVVANEKAENMVRYGLASPAISFAAVDSKGGKSALVVGKKDGEAYFARDLSRPLVFSIDQALHTKLSETLDDLRDKSVVHVASADVERMEIRNASGTIVLSRKNPDEWVFESPVAQKGKSAAGDRVLDALTALQAEQLIDRPAANLLTQFAGSTVTAVLTLSGGKTLTVRFSKPSGDFVYAQASDSPALYKLKKNLVDSLNSTPAELVSAM
jgi:Domain of unknown function (DUF4340)